MGRKEVPDAAWILHTSKRNTRCSVAPFMVESLRRWGRSFQLAVELSDLSNHLEVEP